MRLSKNVAIALIVVGLALFLLYALVRRYVSLLPDVGPQVLGVPEPPRHEFGRPRR